MPLIVTKQLDLNCFQPPLKWVFFPKNPWCFENKRSTIANDKNTFRKKMPSAYRFRYKIPKNKASFAVQPLWLTIESERNFENRYNFEADPYPEGQFCKICIFWKPAVAELLALLSDFSFYDYFSVRCLFRNDGHCLLEYTQKKPSVSNIKNETCG